VDYVKRVAYVERIMADVYYHHVPWCGYINFESESLGIGNNHLVMGEVYSYIGIRHLSPFSYLFRIYSTVSKYGCAAII